MSLINRVFGREKRKSRERQSETVKSTQTEKIKASITSPPSGPIVQDSNEQKCEFRWYFLTVGSAMGTQTFESLCKDDEFKSVPIGEAVRRAKIMVRYYSGFRSAVKSHLEKLESQAVNFRGYAFPLDINKPAFELHDLTGACDEIFDPMGSSEKPIMVILADDRFDEIMRNYGDLLNKRYIEAGGLPIVRMIYTDDNISAISLASILDLEQTNESMENKFNKWCAEQNLDPNKFVRGQPQNIEISPKAPTIAFEDVESFRRLLLEQYNLSESRVLGTFEIKTIIDILKQIEGDISLYFSLSYSIAFKSLLKFIVFPKDQFGENLEFNGLGIFSISPAEYLNFQCLTPNDIGLKQGNIMTGFVLDLMKEMDEEKLEKLKYERTDLDELTQRISQRQEELGVSR